MFTVEFFSFAKKENSTKRPNAGSGIVFECVAKDTLSMYTPVIAVRLSNGNAPQTRNYAYIAEFDRYYFIDSWECERGIWYCSMHVDVLASFKTEIGGNTEFVIRSSSEWDLDLVDNQYPLESVTTTVKDSENTPWNINNGMLLVSILGMGSTNYYLMDSSDFTGLISFMFSDAYLDGLYPDWHVALPSLKAETNPLQFIGQVKWLPIRATTGGAIHTQIPVGYVMCPCICQSVPANSFATYDVNFTLRKHPQASRGAYLNKAPYTTYELYFPPYGMIDLDSNLIGDETKLKLQVKVDLWTGKSTLRITTDRELTYDSIITILNADLGVDVQYSQLTRGSANPTSFLQPFTQAITGNFIGAISNTLTAMGNATIASKPTVRSFGSDGSKSGLDNWVVMLYHYKRISDESLTTFGRPLCKSRSLGSLGGYMVIENPKPVISNATYQEVNQIKNYMTGGFYYE